MQNTIIINLNICFECGADAEEMHHIVPRSRGGVKTIPLCSKCHGKAHGLKRRIKNSDLIKEGLDKARKNGKKLGRPSGSPETNEEFLEKYPHIIKLLKEGHSVRETFKINDYQQYTTIKKIRKLIGDQL